ncbi:hypothetical protein J6590_006424 [Homalodisca vitripennis]|nr:hypothetical protein J6590_006424 [Homalodisca vitripennis]
MYSDTNLWQMLRQRQSVMEGSIFVPASVSCICPHHGPECTLISNKYMITSTVALIRNACESRVTADTVSSSRCPTHHLTKARTGQNERGSC